MKKQTMKVFTVYLEDGENCYKVTVPAFTVQQATQYVEGNGDVIAVKEHSKEKGELVDINCELLANTLEKDNWGQMEIDIITRALISVGLAR